MSLLSDKKVLGQIVHFESYFVFMCMIFFKLIANEDYGTFVNVFMCKIFAGPFSAKGLSSIAPFE